MQFDDNKIKYLEMIQTIVSRMASNGFILKGWMISILTGLAIVGFTIDNNYVILIVYVPVVVFWMLDAYYLQLERKYRKLYLNALEVNPNDIDFKLHPPKSLKEDDTTYFKCLFSVTECGFYLTTLAINVIITIISIN